MIMSKSIKSLVVEGVSQKTGNAYKLLSVTQGQYPWSLGAQECLRVLGAYGVLGPDGLKTVVEGHANGLGSYEPTAGHSYTEYKGHKLLCLHAEKGDKRPLSFGAGKAKGLLALIQEYGVKALVGVCVEVAGDAKPSAYSPKGGKGKGKSAPKGGGGGRGASASADTETLDDTPGLSEGLKGQLLRIAEGSVPSPAPAPQDSLEALEARKVALLEELMMTNLEIARLSQAVAV